MEEKEKEMKHIIAEKQEIKRKQNILQGTETIEDKERLMAHLPPKEKEQLRKQNVLNVIHQFKINHLTSSSSI